MPGGAGGGGVGGGGASGQSPYVPGENDRLTWANATNLSRILNREEGNTRPLLVLVYSSSHAEDCCAANFERTVFRYDRVVSMAKSFDCMKYQTSGNSPLYRKFGLNKKKPAILLLDAEGGLIHKQQECADPKKYSKVVKSALGLNQKRIDLRQKYLAKRQEIRDMIEGREFKKALRSIEKTLKKKNYLMGDVQNMIEADQAEIAEVGQSLFDQAVELRSKKQYQEALGLFKEIKKEFAKLGTLSKEASKRAKEVSKTMRDLGLSSR